MQKRTPILLAIALSVLPWAGHAASAIVTPQQYCTALAQEYDRYIASSHGTNHMGEYAYGEAECKTHEAQLGIPILEKALKAGKLPLPVH